MTCRFTIILIALCAVLMPAIGQNGPKNDTKAATSCPEAKDLINTDLFGAWVLELQNDTTLSTTPSTALSTTARLTLERNPEFAESLAGHFLQGSIRHEVFGDIEAGVLDLEESNNGKDILAIWKGRAVSGGCGKAIAGTRRMVSTQIEQNFVLRRSGW